jgi:hypothetical protein
VSILTALVFTILTCRYLYRQFKKQFIDENR